MLYLRKDNKPILLQGYLIKLITEFSHEKNIKYQIFNSHCFMNNYEWNRFYI